jgi:hypothetical protein
MPLLAKAADVQNKVETLQADIKTKKLSFSPEQDT